MMSIQASDEQHREAVRGKILDAARQTLIKKGYGKFTMRGVAEALAGYSLACRVRVGAEFASVTLMAMVRELTGESSTSGCQLSTANSSS